MGSTIVASEEKLREGSVTQLTQPRNGGTGDRPRALAILIHGAHCADLESFRVSEIKVLFGCPPCVATAGC